MNEHHESACWALVALLVFSSLFWAIAWGNTVVTREAIAAGYEQRVSPVNYGGSESYQVLWVKSSTGCKVEMKP